MLDLTDSTMAELRRRAPDLTGPTWVMAHTQSAPTGRRGRPWAMPAGNFAASLYLPLTDERPGHAALRSFVASLALFHALGRFVAPARLALKWPNDVLFDGGKLAGILLESQGDARGLTGLAIGIGVNLAAAPDATAIEPGAFAPIALDATVPPEDFLDALAAAYAPLETQFKAFGFAAIRPEWLRHAVRLGAQITARTTRTETTGIFETVDEDGNLILATAQGRTRIAAGDVFF